MPIRVKLLKEEKQLLDESLLDPMVIGGALAAIGIAPFVIDKIRNKLRLAKISNLSASDASQFIDDTLEAYGIDPGEVKQQAASKRSSARVKLKQMKAAREQPSSETAMVRVIDPKDLQLYVNIMNRINSGEGSEDNPTLVSLVDKYGKQELEAAAADKLYEFLQRALI